MFSRHIVTIVSVVSFAVALTAAASPAAAQPHAGRGMGMPRYDKTTEVTVSGTVEAVLQHDSRMGMAGSGTHLTFKTDTGTLDVHVGPTNWLAEKKFDVTKGDRLEVIGSRVTIDGQAALIAREISKGDVKITLRDANGIPRWSGRGGGTQS